tara:strand:+ start:234 stop:392 length:159 start_codon:yes stop_codon:yes gene_type:complete
MSDPLSSTVHKICEDGCFCERCIPGVDEDEVWELLMRLAECGAVGAPVSSIS